MKLLLICVCLPLSMLAQNRIYFNGNIFTADPTHPYAEAVAIRGEKFAGAGNLSDMKKILPDAVLTDLHGQTVLPGFVDSHMHGISGGRGLTHPNVQDELLSIDSLYRYALSALQHPELMTGDVMVMYGLNIATWSRLDSIISLFNSGVFKTQAVALRGSDGHTGFANQVMLKRAGVDKAFIASLKGDDLKYFGHTENGEPNGFVAEDGYGKISIAFPAVHNMQAAALKTMEYANGLGITAWLDPSAGNTTKEQSENLDAYQWLQQQHKLTAHIAATIVAEADSAVTPQIDMVRKLQKKYKGQDLNILGFKIFADGVIEHPTHTASLSLPYTDTKNEGVLMFNPAKFKAFVTEADRQHLLVHVHAIGDRAVTETLNGFEAARKKNGNNILPHTITHMQIVQPSDFTRFKALHVLASLQLLWAFGDVTTIDIVQPCIAPALFKWQYPARSLLQAGVTICGASDWPVSTANPFEAIYNAETRKGPMGVLDPSQCMPRMAMLYAYTIESAKALMLEKEIGSIEAGKWADMIIVDRDVLTTDAENMKGTQVKETIFRGQTVYHRDQP